MAGMAPWAGPLPRRARQLIPAGVPRRGELIAVCVLAVLIAHLLLAQLTLVLAVVFALAGRASRWRPWWLAVPAAAGLAWTLAAGPGNAVDGFIAGPSAIVWHLAGGHLAGRAARPLAGFGGARNWLPRQFPVALPCAAAEAALIGWLAWLHTDEWAVRPPRPGLIAAVRRARATRAVRAGAVVTRAGCALGVVTATGAVAELRWDEAAGGTLVVGAAARDVALTGLQVVHAALRRRKPVIVLDGGDDDAVARAVGAACRATGVPLLAAGGQAGPAAAARVASAAPAGDAEPARAAIGSARPAAASGLWGRGDAREPGADDLAATDLDRVLQERCAALLTAAAAEPAAVACAGLTALAGRLRRIGVDGDALVWVPRSERVPARALGELLRAGPEAGLSVVIGTTAPAAAAELAGLTGTVLIHRVADPGLAASLAARTGTRLLPRPLATALAGQAALAGRDAADGMGAGPGQGTRAGPDAGAVTGPGPAAPGGTGLAGTAGGGTAGGGTAAAAAAADLVPSPAIAAGTLLTLGRGEFVLAASRPRPPLAAPPLAAPRLTPWRLTPRGLSAPRLVTRGLMVPARLPPAAGGRLARREA